MIYKQRRNQGGKVVEAAHYTGSYQLPWMSGWSTAAIKTAYAEIAHKRLRQFIQVKEFEHEGRSAPSHLWGAPKRDIDDLLRQYGSTVYSKGRNAKYVHDTVTRVDNLSTACGWKNIDRINPNDFEKWRASNPTNARTGKRLSIKTVNEYLISIRSFVTWLRELGHL